MKNRIESTRIVAVQKDHVIMRGGKCAMKLTLDQILYFQQSGRFVRMETITREWPVGNTMQVLEEDFPNYFHRCHSYLMVNLKSICRLVENTVEFTCGKTVYLGKNAFRTTLDAYCRHHQAAD